MTDIRRVEHRCGDAADGDDSAAARHLGEKRPRRLDLGTRRPAVRSFGTGMRGHDIPEQHIVLDPELAQDSVHDRRRRLARPCACQLLLGRERDAAHARAAVSRRLADEDRRGVPLEMRTQALTAQLGVRVLVVRPADARGREPVYQRFQCTTSSTVRRRCVARLVCLLHSGSGAPWPSVTPVTMRSSSGMRKSLRKRASSSTCTP